MASSMTASSTPPRASSTASSTTVSIRESASTSSSSSSDLEGGGDVVGVGRVYRGLAVVSSSMVSVVSVTSFSASCVCRPGARTRIGSSSRAPSGLGSWVTEVLRRSVVGEHVEDQLGEDEVEPEHQRRHHDHGHQHHDGVGDELTTRRPVDLAELLTNLLEELAGTRALLLLRGRGGTARRAWSRLRDVRPVRPSRAAPGAPASASSACSWISLAGAEGLEPPTFGFGDRCSTRLSYAPRLRSPRSLGTSESSV